MPLVKKTYHCKVIRLTNTKQVALQQEYDNLQHYLQTRKDRGLYSANRQQADRFYKAIKKTSNAIKRRQKRDDEKRSSKEAGL